MLSAGNEGHGTQGGWSAKGSERVCGRRELLTADEPKGSRAKRRRGRALSGSFLRWPELETVLRSYREVLKNDRSMPLHWQVEQALKKTICLLEGGGEELFFSEREIAELLSVSASTASRAMKALIAEGCVRRRRGKRGYAVVPAPIVMHLERNSVKPDRIATDAVSEVLVEAVSRRVMGGASLSGG